MFKINAFFSGTYFIILLMIALSMGSCVSQKKLMYLLDETSNTEQQQIDNQYWKEYTIKPHDNLYIRVMGLDEKTINLFSIQPATYSQYLSNEMSVYLSSYAVNSEGFIEFPLIGKIFVKDKTVEQVKDLVTEAIGEYILEGSVIIKLVNFRVSVLGEVVRPGRFPVYQNQMNIFEAIAMAGDMSPWGNRKNVQVIRKTETGSVIHHIDLTKRSILAAEVYYLMPDDIIYVTPMNAKTFAFTSFPYQVVFSTITTALLILNFIK